MNSFRVGHRSRRGKALPRATESPGGAHRCLRVRPPRETPERAEGFPSAIRRTRYDEPIVLDSEPGAFIFGSWRNVFIGIWESQATMAAVDRMVKATDAMSELHPTGRSTIHIVVHGAGLPSAEVRAHFVDVLKKNADQNRLRGGRRRGHRFLDQRAAQLRHRSALARPPNVSIFACSRRSKRSRAGSPTSTTSERASESTPCSW